MFACSLVSCRGATTWPVSCSLFSFRAGHLIIFKTIIQSKVVNGLPAMLDRPVNSRWSLDTKCHLSRFTECS